MGCIVSKIGGHTEILRMWDLVVKIDDNRLTEKALCWDKTFRRFSWCPDIHETFKELQIEQVFYSEDPVNINWAKDKLLVIFGQE